MRAKAPLACLVLMSNGLYLFHLFSGHFQTRIAPDTSDYVELAGVPLFSDAHLGHARTIGYPLLLRFASLFASDHAAAPAISLLLYLAGVASIYIGLGAWGVLGWRRTLTTCPLLLCEFARLPYCSWLLTDLPAAAWSLIASGCWMLVIARNSRAGWLGMALAGVAAWQTRPGCQTLAVLLPAASCIALPLLRPGLDFYRRASIASLVALVTLGPLLAFCTLRAARVGHFGVVSYYGTNQIGITGQLLDEPLADKLPLSHRPQAMTILRVQRRLMGEEIEPLWGPWRSPLGEGVVSGPGVNAYMLRVQFSAFRQAAVTALYTEHGKGMNNVRFDAMLTSLSKSIIAADRTRFAKWVYHATRENVLLAMTRPIPLLLLAALFGALAMRCWMAVRRAATGAVALVASRLQLARTLALATLSLGHLASQALASALAIPAQPRMIDLMGLLIPIWLADALLGVLVPEPAPGSPEPVSAPE